MDQESIDLCTIGTRVTSDRMETAMNIQLLNLLDELIDTWAILHVHRICR
jgi:hypothetical protein